jgi:hypothetical protein
VKVGDMVKRSGDESQAWVVTKLKSDSIALWIIINEGTLQDDEVWHKASYFEVINENR